MSPREYIVKLSAEIAERYTEWTPVADIEPDWFKVIPNDDGTAEVWLSIGDEPPKESA